MGPISAASVSTSSTRNLATGGPGAPSSMSAVEGVMKNANQYSDLSVAGNASHVLASGGDFLNAAGAAVQNLDRQIDTRTDRLQNLKKTGGASEDVMNHEATQIDLLTKLRDRLELSMKRVANIIAGKDMDDDTTAAASSKRRKDQAQDYATAAAASAHAALVGGAGAVNVVQPIAAPSSIATTPGSTSSTGSGSGDPTMHAALRAYNQVAN
ncbi:MAG: hypothetical protein H7123_01045 [Thermoleophilia bacterium]|nr:hypothetical protein [Thermoleophilia bacterium]